jgi:hypothetical protein
MIRQKQQKKSSTLDSFQGQELITLEKAKITGGYLNLFGIYHIHGIVYINPKVPHLLI